MRQPKDWKAVFFDIAFAMAEKSKDDSTQCGAVLVGKGNVILSTGFNGPPPGIEDTAVPWNVRPDKYAFIIHAEENALLYALDRGGSECIAGSTVYTTHMPCAECTLRLIRSKVAKVCVPQCHKAYPLSKFQVDADRIVEAKKQTTGNLYIELVEYVC